MKIYIGHSRGFDYEQELYLPLRNSDKLAQYNIILPHENNNSGANPREFYNNIDLFIAEVSYPATGLGIELGWASDAKVPIVAISQAQAQVSGSIKAVTSEFHTYKDDHELTELIQNIIQKHQDNPRRHS